MNPLVPIAPDVKLKFHDGSYLEAHRSVLCFLFPFFRDFFSEFPEKIGEILMPESIKRESLMFLLSKEDKVMTRTSPIDEVILLSYLLSYYPLSKLKNIVIEKGELEKYKNTLLIGAKNGEWDEERLDALLSSLRVSNYSVLNLSILPISELIRKLRVPLITIKYKTSIINYLPLDGTTDLLTIPYFSKNIISNIKEIKTYEGKTKIINERGKVLKNINSSFVSMTEGTYFCLKGDRILRLNENFTFHSEFKVKGEIKFFRTHHRLGHVAVVSNTFAIYDWNTGKILKSWDNYIVSLLTSLTYAGDYLFVGQITLNGKNIYCYSAKDYALIWLKCYFSHVVISPSGNRIYIDGNIYKTEGGVLLKTLLIKDCPFCFDLTDEIVYCCVNNVLMKCTIGDSALTPLIRFNVPVVDIEINPEFRIVYKDYILFRTLEYTLSQET